MALVAHVIARDNGLCWRCGHDGADTGGHILPVATHPELALNPDNLRAEHGRKRTAAVDGFDCIGNYAAGAHAGRASNQASTHEGRRRPWLEEVDDDHLRYRR